MNDLNLQNDAFCEVANNVRLENNKIIVSLYPKPFIGTIGPWLLLESSDSVLSEIQTWKLTVLIYGTDGFRPFSGGITTFDEIKSKLE